MKARASGRRSAAEARIVEAARRLFIEHGLAAVNMAAIAAAAGVVRQTLYNRFGSKEAVFAAALDAHWASLADAARHLDPLRPPRDVLADVAAELLAFLADGQQIAMTRMVIAESRQAPDLAQQFYARGKGPLLERFIAYLGEATAAGQLACADPRLAARQFLGMIQESLLWPRVMGLDDVDDAAAVVTGAIRVFLAAYSP